MEGDEETLKGQSGGEKAAEIEEEEEAGIHPPSRSISKRKEKCASQIFVCRNHCLHTVWECFSHPLGCRKNLAKLYFESNRELEGIFNLVESDEVSLPTTTQMRSNQAR